jgi:hypothetical protein
MTPPVDAATLAATVAAAVGAFDGVAAGDEQAVATMAKLTKSPAKVNDLERMCSSSTMPLTRQQPADGTRISNGFN